MGMSAAYIGPIFLALGGLILSSSLALVAVVVTNWLVRVWRRRPRTEKEMEPRRKMEKM